MAKNIALNPGDMVSIYLEDNPTLGTGERYLIVLTVGCKWITFFYLPLLATVKLTPEEYLANTRRKLVQLLPVNRRFNRKLIQDKRKLYDENNMQYSAVNADLAYKLLG